MNKFKIHLFDSMHSGTLYDYNGREIFTLEEAKIAANEFHLNEKWEVYNGEEGYCNQEEHHHDR